MLSNTRWLNSLLLASNKATCLWFLRSVFQVCYWSGYSNSIGGAMSSLVASQYRQVVSSCQEPVRRLQVWGIRRRTTSMTANFLVLGQALEQFSYGRSSHLLPLRYVHDLLREVRVDVRILAVCECPKIPCARKCHIVIPQQRTLVYTETSII